ncbi:MAG: helix-turn-helix domain-containing protein [Gammaproteobacteria bacterium]
MNTHSGGAIQTRPLEILDISEPEEQTYRWLLAHPGATASETAQALMLTPRKTQRLLDAIEAKGLTTHSPEHPRRYIPALPDIALKALAIRCRGELQRAESVIQDLQEKAVTQRRSKQAPMVELITNREAERQVFEHLQRGAQHEVLSLVRPPILISRLEMPYEEDQSTQQQAQARGVHYRGIVDTQFLALPGAITRIRNDIKSGEDVRVFPCLPFKMGLADRRIALIPLNLQQLHGPSLVLRSSALLDALYALFEVLWERSVPISFSPSGNIDTGKLKSPLPEAAEDILSFMAAGLKDKALAYELDISSSTLTRRISELMQALDARSRFQLGWTAALRLSCVPPGSSGVAAKSNLDRER